jgi:Asp-tRNA(Asn)/Glu-tRNA(Gln) amidotransferase A subunit family amidase
MAAGLCFGSLGTDTGGSIRFPSAANAVTGLKPTWGRVSRHGAFELAASLDHIGPMCRSAADCGLMLAAIAGADSDDPTALQAPVPDFLAGDIATLSDLRIGIDEAYALDDVEPEVAAAVRAARDTFSRLGAQIVSVTMPPVDELVESWVPHCAVEAAVAHSVTFPARRAEYGPMLAALLLVTACASPPDGTGDDAPACDGKCDGAGGLGRHGPHSRIQVFNAAAPAGHAEAVSDRDPLLAPLWQVLNSSLVCLYL